MQLLLILVNAIAVFMRVVAVLGLRTGIILWCTVVLLLIPTILWGIEYWTFTNWLAFYFISGHSSRDNRWYFWRLVSIWWYTCACSWWRWWRVCGFIAGDIAAGVISWFYWVIPVWWCVYFLGIRIFVIILVVVLIIVFILIFVVVFVIYSRLYPWLNPWICPDISFDNFSPNLWCPIFNWFIIQSTQIIAIADSTDTSRLFLNLLSWIYLSRVVYLLYWLWLKLLWLLSTRVSCRWIWWLLAYLRAGWCWIRWWGDYGGF